MAIHRTRGPNRSTVIRVLTLPLAAAIAIGCKQEVVANPVMDALAAEGGSGTGPSVALRFPATEGAGVRIYRLPGLDPVPWRFRIDDLSATRAVGFVPSEDAVYVQSDSGAFLGLDLSSGRTWMVDSLVDHAVLGPTNITLAVRQDSTLGVVSDRRFRPWSDTLPSLPTRLWGTAAGRFLAEFETEEGPVIGVLQNEWDSTTTPLPPGRMAVSAWGDLIAVADGTTIVALTTATGATEVLQMDEDLTTVGISASAHLLYAITSASELVVINRYTMNEITRAPLPGEVDEIRVDRWGRYLMLRPATGGEIWIARTFGIASPKGTPIEVARVPGLWDEDLPAVAIDGTVLLRQDDALVAFDPATGVEAGRVAGGEADTWLMISWDPRPPALQMAEETPDPVDSPGGLLYYAQISSTSNEAWAQDLANRLRSGGVDAQVMRPSDQDDRYRVVLGPYEARQEADDIGRRLGRAYFVFSLEDTTATADTTANSQ